nr:MULTISPECIES: YkgJ family cysteine cluster protein [unclassified Duganella]
MHYDDTSKLCRIYDSRPAICRVDVQFTLHYQSQMSWQQFCELNVAACSQLAQWEQQK